MSIRSTNFCEIVRWCTYLLFFCTSCEAQYHYYRQSDSRFNGTASNSSPNFHISNTEPIYSPWSDWTACSTTCGTGISSRSRTCLKSTHNSRGVPVPLCHGEFSEHRICNVKPCLSTSLDVREYQCSQHDKEVVAGKFVESWIPSNGGPNPCELRCEAKSGTLVYSFGKASDGTPCPLGVCLDGRCLRVGCDERLGSGVALDMCGVCGGRNASCVHYKDVYQGQPAATGSRGTYHEVVVIPFAARNLIIRQPLGKNILALQDRSKGIIFNGEHSSSKYGGQYEIAGSKVEFMKVENYFELLLVKGPLTQELNVLVLLRANNPGIYYEYWLPKQAHSPIKSHYPLKSLPEPPFPTTPIPPTTGVSYTVPFYKSSPHHHSFRHPTKPPFAYGYGDKPQKGQDSPIFRTTPPTKHPLKLPQPQFLRQDSPIFRTTPPTKHPPKLPQPEFLRQDSPKELLPLYKKGPVPIYKPSRPAFDYYQTFRNQSVPKSDPLLELPSLTQGDSGDVGGLRHANQASEEDNKKVSLSKYPKPLKTEFSVNKRYETPVKSYVPVPNGRLKYSFETKNDEVYLNNSQSYTPEPLTINVLSLPDAGKQKSRDQSKSDQTQKPRPARGGVCQPCLRIKNQLKHFCSSDFVVRAQVIGYEFLQGETRYELEVKQSFKNTLSLLPKEYVWSPDTCRCPRLRTGKEYVIMGHFDSKYKKRESRLLVDKSCFVRTYNLKYARRLQKLRKDQDKKCQKKVPS